jgi:hypothetical protein
MKSAHAPVLFYPKPAVEKKQSKFDSQQATNDTTKHQT